MAQRRIVTRAARARPLLRAEHVDERRRGRRPLGARVHGDLADEPRLEAQHRALDPGQRRCCRARAPAEPGRREPRRALGLRRAHRPARAEPGAAADLLEDPGEAVVRVVEHPLAVGELLERGRRAARRAGRPAATTTTNSSHATSRAARPTRRPAAARSRSRRRPARPRPRAAMRCRNSCSRMPTFG